MSVACVDPAEVLDCCGETIVSCKCADTAPPATVLPLPCIECDAPRTVGMFCDWCFVNNKDGFDDA